MNRPNLEIIAPTSRAFDGMKWCLFQPFDIGKWFILGFTAWLAALMDGGGSTPSGDFSSSSSGSLEEAINELMTWVRDNIEVVIGVGSIVAIIAVALWIALTWVSSRGMFMFLDNLVHNRALVSDPWSRFKTLANSLCLWRLAFSLVVFLLVVPVIILTLFLFAGLQGGREIMIPGLVAGGLALFVIVIAAAYIGVLLEDFVIPTMYRRNILVNAAWKEFLALHSQSLGSFLLYALWRILLSILIGIVVLTLGFATCCIGFFIMAIPYLGTVLLLPVSVFMRLLGPEFLRQFGPDHDILTTRDQLWQNRLAPPVP